MGESFGNLLVGEFLVGRRERIDGGRDETLRRGQLLRVGWQG